MGLAILITKSQNQRISSDTNSVDCKVEYKYGVINGLKSLRFKIPKTCVQLTGKSGEVSSALFRI